MKLDDGTVISSAFKAQPMMLEHGFHHVKRSEHLKIGTIISVRNVDSSDGLQKSQEVNEDGDTGSPFETVYDVRVDDHNSRPVMYNGCRALKPFFGVNNYFDMVHESADLSATFSAGGDPIPGFFNQAAESLVGARCVVLCVEGEPSSGVILGFLQHPARPSQITEDMGTHMEFEFNGIHVTIDKDGTFTLEGNGPLIDAEGPPTGPVPDLGVRQDPTIGPFTISLDKDMVFTVSDNLGQTFTIDRSTPQIQIDSGAGDTLTVDTAGGNIAIVINEAFTVDPSFGDHFEVSSENGIQGTTPAAGGTSFSFKNGDVDISSANADLSMDKTGSVSFDAGADFSISAKTGISIESETTLSLKGVGGEVQDLLNQIITAIGTLVISSPVGPCAPLTAAPQWVQIQQLLTQLQLNMG